MQNIPPGPSQMARGYFYLLFPSSKANSLAPFFNNLPRGFIVSENKFVKFGRASKSYLIARFASVSLSLSLRLLSRLWSDVGVVRFAAAAAAAASRGCFLGIERPPPLAKLLLLPLLLLCAAHAYQMIVSCFDLCFARCEVCRH